MWIVSFFFFIFWYSDYSGGRTMTQMRYSETNAKFCLGMFKEREAVPLIWTKSYKACVYLELPLAVCPSHCSLVVET